ncbi:SGNH/GDSL hydrolase family protein [Lacinutrix chionoecetis]
MKIIILFFSITLFCSCSTNRVISQELNNHKKSISILALGDSYTIGESVCKSCRFPEQLKDSLISRFGDDKSINVKIIAETGWTTSDLKEAILRESVQNNYDFVTLLIGVNNQYQNKPFLLYEKEFPELVNTAIEKANGNKEKIIVISIPDYAYTPFGKENSKISTDIDKYNAFAKAYCKAQDVTFLNITDITRQGIEQPNLVASDGLHPSKLAYSKFVERLLPLSLEIIK